MGHGSWSRGSWVSSLMGHVGHGSVHWWVTWVMGHVGHGSVHWWVRWVMGHVVHGSVPSRVRWVMGHVVRGSVQCWVDGSQNLTHCQLWYRGVHGDGKAMAHRKVSWWHGLQLEFKTRENNPKFSTQHHPQALRNTVQTIQATGEWVTYHNNKTLNETLYITKARDTLANIDGRLGP